jgi:membrane dipeptidase
MILVKITFSVTLKSFRGHMKKTCCLFSHLAAGAILMCSASAAWSADANTPATSSRIKRILAKTPLIDGHNDLPEMLREALGDQAPLADFSGRAGTQITKFQTDIARLRKGYVGGQFWSVWIDVSITGSNAIKKTLEQIDLVRAMVARNPQVFALANTADDIMRIHRNDRIASMIGVEGGHQIGESMAALRQYHALGVRYMTLTHSRNNALADSATDNPVHNGLSPFGRAVVTEMNRLGMLVDLAHVSPDVMRQAISLSKAPVIFSHSGARAVTEHPRNVPDDVLKMLTERDGVVMINFYSAYISSAYNQWKADEAAEIARTNAPPFGGLYIGQPEKAKAALDAWHAAHPRPVATIKDVADHLDYLVKVAGIDHVGIGGDFDGVGGETPEGLASVADYPKLFAELMKRGWSDDMLAKLAGGNVLRVMRKAEALAMSMKDVPISIAVAVKQ